MKFAAKNLSPTNLMQDTKNIVQKNVGCNHTLIKNVKFAGLKYQLKPDKNIEKPEDALLVQKNYFRYIFANIAEKNSGLKSHIKNIVHNFVILKRQNIT